METANVIGLKITGNTDGAEQNVAILLSEAVDSIMKEQETEFVKRIQTIKARLSSAIKSYYDGAMSDLAISSKEENISTRQRMFISVRQDYYVTQMEFYSKLFSNFTIESYRRVVYNGTKYTRQESVRRLTAIHLEELREVDKPKSDEVHLLLKEYEKLLKVYLKEVQTFSLEF